MQFSEHISFTSPFEAIRRQLNTPMTMTDFTFSDSDFFCDFSNDLKFLDEYTEDDFMKILTEYGFLDDLKKMGYSQPLLRMECKDKFVHRLSLLDKSLMTDPDQPITEKNFLMDMFMRKKNLVTYQLKAYQDLKYRTNHLSEDDFVDVDKMEDIQDKGKFKPEYFRESSNKKKINNLKFHNSKKDRQKNSNKTNTNANKTRTRTINGNHNSKEINDKNSEVEDTSSIEDENERNNNRNINTDETVSKTTTISINTAINTATESFSSASSVEESVSDTDDSTTMSKTSMDKMESCEESGEGEGESDVSGSGAEIININKNTKSRNQGNTQITASSIINSIFSFLNSRMNEEGGCGGNNNSNNNRSINNDNSNVNGSINNNKMSMETETTITSSSVKSITETQTPNLPINIEKNETSNSNINSNSIQDTLNHDNDFPKQQLQTQSQLQTPSQLKTQTQAQTQAQTQSNSSLPLSSPFSSSSSSLSSETESTTIKSKPISNNNIDNSNSNNNSNNENINITTTQNNIGEDGKDTTINSNINMLDMKAIDINNDDSEILGSEKSIINNDDIPMTNNDTENENINNNTNYINNLPTINNFNTNNTNNTNNINTNINTNTNTDTDTNINTNTNTNINTTSIENSSEEIRKRKLTPLIISKHGATKVINFLEKNINTTPEMKITEIEWVCMQNPRGKFSTLRPQCPGQRFPGLKMGRKISNLMISLAKIKGRDGLADTPEHFHNATIYSQKGYMFINPAFHGYFVSLLYDLNKDLREYGLAAVSWAFKLGHVINRKTGKPEFWHPEEQIYPTSNRLHKYFISDQYLAFVEHYRKIHLNRVYIDWNEAKECLIYSIKVDKIKEISPIIDNSEKLRIGDNDSDNDSDNESENENDDTIIIEN